MRNTQDSGDDKSEAPSISIAIATTLIIFTRIFEVVAEALGDADCEKKSLTFRIYIYICVCVFFPHPLK